MPDLFEMSESRDALAGAADSLSLSPRDDDDDDLEDEDLDDEDLDDEEDDLDFDDDDDDDDEDDDNDVSKQRGVFTTLPDGTAMGLTISGFAKITRSEDGTKVKALVRGLAPRTTYAAHLHNAPCSAANPGGGHYMNVPGGPAMPPNELWLSSTDDPFAGITSNAGGVAFGRGSADWIARPEAQSVVIHFIPPGGTTAGGPKIACADLL